MMQIPPERTPMGTRSRFEIIDDLSRQIVDLRETHGSDLPVYFFPMIRKYILKGRIPEVHLEPLAKIFENKYGSSHSPEAVKFFDALFVACQAERLDLSMSEQGMSP